MYKSVMIFAIPLAAIIGFYAYHVVDAHADNAKTFLIAETQTPVQNIYKRQGEKQMANENTQTSAEVKKQKYSEAWNKTKSFSAETWDKTKSFSAKTWDKTKSFSTIAWDKTKSLSAEAWGVTKEAADDIYDAIMCDECCTRERINAKQQEKNTAPVSKEKNN
ncbi:MAG: hypothetical protein MJ212_01120 [Alphaproteobacteria bacterium]|nr:hypothetical protein [Alphaproteobacteria bacterium]